MPSEACVPSSVTDSSALALKLEEETLASRSAACAASLIVVRLPTTTGVALNVIPDGCVAFQEPEALVLPATPIGVVKTAE